MADLLMKMPLPYEPKRQNRFILRFPSSLGINEWFVESAARPHITINATEIPFLNTSTYVAGRFTWQTINVVFRDPIGPSAAQALMEWVRLCAESVTGRMGYTEIGISTNGVRSATYSNSLTTATSDVTGKYNGYTTAVLGFGSKISLGDNFPLILNVGVRLQYGITDAAGVDALGIDLTNKVAYPTYQKSSAASAGIHVGLTYRIK
jgi:hypothetical protein